MKQSSDDRFRDLEKRLQLEQTARKAAEDKLAQKCSELAETTSLLESLNGLLEDRIKSRTNELEGAKQKALELTELDQLTHLANRYLFRASMIDAVAQVKDTDRSFSLILIDLVDFKSVNDGFGYDTGDAVLQKIAKRITGSIRQGDIAARLGGDEFAVLLFDVEDSCRARKVCGRLLDNIQAPISIGNDQIRCAVSLGVAQYPQHTGDIEELQIFADLALRQARDQGRGHSVFFEEKLAAPHTLRNSMGRDLEEAIFKEKIEVFFQPIVRLDTRSFPGAEALLRWEHPDHGSVAPLDVLSLARERGLLGLLTRRIIRSGMMQASSKLKSGELEWISINLAEYDLRDQELPGFILNELFEQHIPPECLQLEITEHAVISDVESARSVMEQLNSAGVRFAIDDFGTGYSNLQLLHQLPFHTMKIDRSFTAKVFELREIQTIVKAMVDLGHALKIEVTAEGVENIQQGEILRSIGCDYGQGYLYGHPVRYDVENTLPRIGKTRKEEILPVAPPRKTG